MQKEIALDKANKRSASSAFPGATEPSKKNSKDTGAPKLNPKPVPNQPVPPSLPPLPDTTNNQTVALLPDVTQNLLPDTTSGNNVTGHNQ